jgi:drug/metabolite transporter (DMT)-like permease
MPHRNARLFALCVAIWGTTWLAIRFQLGEVAPEQSVAYRFLLAAGLSFAIIRVRGRAVVPTGSVHGLLLLFGLSTFTAGYVLVYYAETRITSGLVAVGYSLTPLLNHAAARLALGAPANRRIEQGGVLGVLGVCLVFGPELARSAFDADLLLGGALTLGAVLCSTVGTVLAGWLERRGVGVWQKLSWGMAYGGIGCLALSLLRGQTPSFSLAPAYLLSLAYLVAFGSVAAFAAYLTLFETIGVARAGYVGVLVPVVALIVSAVFEGFEPTWWTALGLLCVLLGQASMVARGPAGERS